MKVSQNSALLVAAAVLVSLVGVLLSLFVGAHPFSDGHRSPGQPMGLAVSQQGVLMLNGKPFRGIGVDYYNLFYAHLENPSDQSYISGLKQLELHQIPFARFMATAYWPKGLKLYLDDPNRYWSLMADIVDQAQKDHVGLIPDFFWTTFTVPDLVGEPLSQWGNPKSKTIQFMKAYVGQFLSHFKDSPAIWGYEFGNEFNNAVDLPTWKSHLPPVNTGEGTPSIRTSSDRLTSSEAEVAYVAFAEEIRASDPTRVIESGNSIDRNSAWHQRYEDSWATDSRAEFSKMLAYLNPRPFDMTSVHYYPGRKLPPYFSSNLTFLKFLNQISKENRQPLFVGEFGSENALNVSNAQTEKSFDSLLQAIVGSGTPLAALWVYDYPKQSNWSVTFANSRAYQLADIERANKVLQKSSSNG